MIEDKPRSAACVAKGAVTVIAIKRKAFLGFLKEFDGLEEQVKQRINRYERADFDRGLLDKSTVGNFGIENITKVLAATMLGNCMYLAIVLVVLVPDLSKFDTEDTTAEPQNRHLAESSSSGSQGAGFSPGWSIAIIIAGLIPSIIMVLMVIPVLVSRLAVLSGVVNIKLDAVEWVCLRHKQVVELHEQVTKEMHNHFQLPSIPANV